VFCSFGMNYIAGELEMPFGDDSNDLPLTRFQEEMNSSLLMLIHDFSNHVPKIAEDRAHREFASLRDSLTDARNSMTHIERARSVRKRFSVYDETRDCLNVDSHADILDQGYDDCTSWADLPPEEEEEEEEELTGTPQRTSTPRSNHAVPSNEAPHEVPAPPLPLVATDQSTNGTTCATVLAFSAKHEDPSGSQRRFVQHHNSPEATSTGKVFDVAGRGNGIVDAGISLAETTKPCFRQPSKGEGTIARAAPDELVLDPEPHLGSGLSRQGLEWSSVSTGERNRQHGSSAAVHRPVCVASHNKPRVPEPNRQQLSRQQPLVASTRVQEPHSHSFAV